MRSGRGRPIADSGVVVEILRRNEGVIDVVPAPSPGFTKGIAVELPIVELPS